MDNEIFRRVGEALYGVYWQSDIARDLGVADRTVRRWASGHCTIPAGVSTELRTLCERRIEDIENAATNLSIVY
jgi:hypothetical protein